jgi:hypothetical protein
MSTITRATASIMALSMLVGCASQSTLNAIATDQRMFASAQANCAATNQWAACNEAVFWANQLAADRQQASYEAQTNGNAVAAGILLGLAAGVAGAAASNSYNYHGGWGHYGGYHHGGWHHY